MENASLTEENLRFLTRNWERGLHYFIVTQRVIKSGKVHFLPVLYAVSSDEGGRIQVTRSRALLDYCLNNSARSHTWMLNRVRTVGALIDFTMAMHPFLRRAEILGSLEASYEKVLERFAKTFLGGSSVAEKGETRELYGLFWQARSAENARTCLAALTDFLKSMSNANDRWKTAAESRYIDPLTAIRLAHESIVRRANNLLSHLDNAFEESPPHRFGGLFGQASRGSKTYAFPVKYIWTLIKKGFRRKKLGDDDCTAKVITLLLFAGGSRQSEVFHLWLQDVQLVDGDPYVFVHHPEEGTIVSSSGRILTRKVALQEKDWGVARNKLGGKRLHSGFKGLDDEIDGAQLHWLPIPEMTRMLAKLLTQYVTVIRPRIMRIRRARGGADHPFLFIGSGDARANGKSEIGAPYSLAAFKSAWRRAVERVAKLCDDPLLVVRKRLGTTIHGTRHFYGRFLNSIGCDAETIRRCMHHKNIRSQDRYKKLTPKEIDELLQKKLNCQDKEILKERFTLDITRKTNSYCF